MYRAQIFAWGLIAFGVVGCLGLEAANDFSNFVKPLFEEHCIQCHGEKKIKGKVNLEEIATFGDLLAKPELLEELVEVIDAYDMPPEDEPELAKGDHDRLLKVLREALKTAAGDVVAAPTPMRRLNRFHYNNSVKDLLRLDRDLFVLKEKLLTRHDDYLSAGTDKMPDEVQVSCQSLSTVSPMRYVVPFPKDLQAAHGFDNQANQLTLSPLLLDAFLQLSVSVVESPDFTPQTVGIWDEFYAAPDMSRDVRRVVEERLRPFMTRAFRRPARDDEVARYATYVTTKVATGIPFETAMKKVTSAVLSSPKFLFRFRDTNANGQYDLAGRLSFFLWGTGPDETLLRLAERGELSNPKVLRDTVTRMINDSKIERFLDSFPSQWLRLENLFGASPDRRQFSAYYVDPKRPASTQMLIEPLLLFDAVFLENRSIMSFIAPEFTYRSDFLNAWYGSDLKPPKINEEDIAPAWTAHLNERERLEERLGVAIDRLAKFRQSLSTNIDGRAARIEPYALWEFNGNLKDAMGRIELKADGEVSFADGMVVLKNAYLKSPLIPEVLTEKTFEVWCVVDDLEQDGGLISISRARGNYDALSWEGARNGWRQLSNNRARIRDLGGRDTSTGTLTQLVVSYEASGAVTFYRDGMRVGNPHAIGALKLPANEAWLEIGRGAGRKLDLRVAKAALYDRALRPWEIASTRKGRGAISEHDLWQAITATDREKYKALRNDVLAATKAARSLKQPPDLREARRQAHRDFDERMRALLQNNTFRREPVEDPRYGGIITNAATMTMTSSPKRTLPITRGSWMIEVVLNDPPPPPPNDVPPLDEEAGPKNQTIREKFALHRENPDCAGCHSRLDPLGFALENYDGVGRWRDVYPNRRKIDPSGTLLKHHRFRNVVEFKHVLSMEDERFAKAFTAHLMRFALARELTPTDGLVVENIVARTKSSGYRLRDLVTEVVASDSFRGGARSVGAGAAKSGDSTK